MFLVLIQEKFLIVISFIPRNFISVSIDKYDNNMIDYMR